MGKLFQDTRVQGSIRAHGHMGKESLEIHATEEVEETEKVSEGNDQCGVQTALCTKDMGEHE